MKSFWICVFFPASFWGLLVFSNTYLALYHDENQAAFYIKTLEGDPDTPADNNSYLLYHKLPPTTLATIRINNEDIIFGSEKGHYEQRPKLISNGISTRWSVRGITIEQTLSFAPNPVTGISNHVRISYKLLNATKKNMSVGLRLLLDIYLRESGVSSFEIPGKGKITKETDFYRESIPEYWYTTSQDKSVMVRGSLKGIELTPPSRVVFASWNKLYDNLWDISLNTSQSLQPSSQYSGAVGLYYDPVTLAPNQSLFITSLYGIHSEESFSTNDISLSLTFPEEVKAPPVPISAEVAYNGKVSLDSLSISLSPPKGFTLPEGDSNTITYLKVNPADKRKAFWNLQRTGSIAGNYPLTVTITAIAGSQTNTLSATKSFFINYREMSSLIITTNIPLPETPTNTSPLPSPLSLSPVVVTNTIVITNTITFTNITLKTYPPRIASKIKEIQTLSQLIDDLTREYNLWLAIYRNSERLSEQNIQELSRRLLYYEEKIRLLQGTNTSTP
ncbi:MAG: hypothetical protein N2314_07160 [Brevinematales bacterium]|nr:hypothetical protein [Brevinematales bacterium]